MELGAQIGTMNPSSSEAARNEPEHPPNPPPADFRAFEASLPQTQPWTTDGYPIVDGKYHNLDTGEVMAHTGLMKGGPPNITVYWQNRFATGRGDQFLVVSKTIYSTRSLSEYIIRIGHLLQRGPGVCKVDSLNATPYSVYVVVTSEASQEEFKQALQEHGLLS
ncbi:predicted protein [Chaetomium globosum CBS 148.51]|uniref:Uncharacterized protein n=1 Tax=Chaetomium globosum (strain ATCC 6205 / CBS 148.51 / DSM 1962 / NBRC 6347 / NRRL 1970) TaxID=306901 RepID=Q2GQM6_CHAGB|nr:uncharacterized protein CHGG_09728 [Chaetomium globosum CBS 148.51]EAQ83324.1 predicted protein [Chaetomium globosum CBS 148.51]